MRSLKQRASRLHLRSLTSHFYAGVVLLEMSQRTKAENILPSMTESSKLSAPLPAAMAVQKATATTTRPCFGTCVLNNGRRTTLVSRENVVWSKVSRNKGNLHDQSCDSLNVDFCWALALISSTPFQSRPHFPLLLDSTPSSLSTRFVHPPFNKSARGHALDR